MLRSEHQVCLADINQDLGLETLREFQDEHGDSEVTFVRCDVTKVPCLGTVGAPLSAHITIRILDLY